MPSTGVAAALMLLLASGLAACAAEPGATSSPSATAASAPDVTETPEGPRIEAPLDPLSCLHGSWLADNEFFLASLREFGDEPTSVTGEVTLTFTAGGSVTTQYSDWRITAIVEGRETIITREGIDEGTFAADESQITINETRMGSVLTVSTGGMDMTIPPEPVNYSQAQYTCAASDASISTPEGTAILSRVEG